MRPDPTRPAPTGGLPLGIELPLLIAGVLVLLLALAGSAAYVEVESAAEDAARQRVERVSRQLAQSNGVAADRRHAQMRAAVPALRATLADPSSAPRADSVLASLVAPADTFSTVVLWDAAGRVVALHGAPLPAAELASGRAQAQAAGELPVYTGGLQARGESIHYWSTAPVDAGGRAIGHVGVRRRVVAAADAERQVRELLGRDMQLYIANRDDSLWSSVQGRPVRRWPVTATSLELVTYERGDTTLLAAPAPVAGTRMAVVIEMPHDAILARPIAFLRRMLVIGALIVLLAGIAAWTVSRRVTRPLGALTAAAEGMTTGDYARRVPVARADELGRLSATFNAMAANVEEARARMARTAERNERLQAVTASLSGALTPQAVAAVIVDRGVPALGAQAGAIALLDAAGAHLTLVRTIGYPPERLAPWRRIPLDARVPVAEVARTGRPRFITSAAELGYDASGAPVDRLVDSQAWATLPLVAEERTLGTLALSFQRAGDFDEEERAFMVTLAQQCALALDRSRLYEAERRARAEAEAARGAAEVANRAKTDFLAVMSHEIRTPINAVLGYAELLELGLAGPTTAAQRTQLGRIRASGRHLLTLVNEVLDLSKIEAGHLVVARRPERAADVVAAALTVAGPPAAGRGLTLEQSGADDVGYVGDAHRVRQILVNLLSNAVKFTEPGGRVAVRWGPAGEGPDGRVGRWCRLEVRDSGIGIAPDQHEAIFDPFVQGDQAHTRTRGGTGLGLAISRRLARLMGGELTVESTPGAGACFTLLLPAADELPARGDDAPAVVPPAARTTGRATPRDVGQLLLEAHEEVVAMLPERLRIAAAPAAVAELADPLLLGFLGPLLAAIGHALATEGVGTPTALSLARDADALLEQVAERHGAARARDGWDENALGVEFAVVRDTVTAALARRGHTAGGPATESLERRLLAAERAARAGATVTVG